jgi:glycine/D-amino acid oxidase-like deaminating enzyme
LIAAVYEVVEYAFDSDILRDTFQEKLNKVGVELRLGARVEQADCSDNESVLQLSSGEIVRTEYLFNCTYAGLKHIRGLEAHCRTPLKYEIAEMALVEPPAELARMGITVMCGPFFSVMPFPPRSLHTLSHVRYTPHASWVDGGLASPNPYQILEDNQNRSHAELMLRDAARYLPLLSQAQIRGSLFEVKTSLIRNESDDGRPVLIERGITNPKIYTIMGGKVDNIYDVYFKLQADGL